VQAGAADPELAASKFTYASYRRDSPFVQPDWNRRAKLSPFAGSRLAFDEASKTFRKLRGYQAMPKLIAGLRAHDAQLDPKSVDGSKRAA
jgi:hypothetical protein